jgi:membrane protease YdiL (CAAX protease family)
MASTPAWLRDHGAVAGCALYTVGLILWGNAKAWLLDSSPSGSTAGVLAGVLLTGGVLGIAGLHRIDWARLGLRTGFWPSLRAGIGVGALGGLSLSVLYGIAAVSGNAPHRAEATTTLGALLLRALVLLPFDTAIPEEVAFRGVLLGWLSTNDDQKRAMAAVFISALPFMAWHVGISQRESGVFLDGQLILKLVGDGVGGVVFGVLRVRTRHLAGSVAAHWLIDGLLILAVRLFALLRAAA